MRCRQLVLLACVLRLPFFIGAQPAGPAAGTSIPGPQDKGPGNKNGPGAPGSPSTVTESTTLTASYASSIFSTPSSSTFSSTSARFSSTTNTIGFSSTISTSSIPPSSNEVASNSAAVATGHSSMASARNTTASAILSPATSSPATLAQATSSSAHRTLIIVLSTVLGFVGLLLIAAALFLAYRFYQGRSPFCHRSVTPLDEDEIESWRGAAFEQKHAPPPDPAVLNRKIASIQLTHSPEWTWAAAPTSPPSAASPPMAVQETPSFLAKAPNSRAGLTDETVPGEEPFLPPMKRQNSRLSKAPPGHARSKSGRSSFSAKSVRSDSGGTTVGPNTTDSSGMNDRMSTWFDPEDHMHAIGIALSRTDRTSSSIGTSILDEFAWGLSPRPKSTVRLWDRDRQIGRAIG